MDVSKHSDEKLRAILTMEADDPKLDPKKFKAAHAELWRRLNDTQKGE